MWRFESEMFPEVSVSEDLNLKAAGFGDEVIRDDGIMKDPEDLTSLRKQCPEFITEWSRRN